MLSYQQSLKDAAKRVRCSERTNSILSSYVRQDAGQWDPSDKRSVSESRVEYWGSNQPTFYKESTGDPRLWVMQYRGWDCAGYFFVNLTQGTVTGEEGEMLPLDSYVGKSEHGVVLDQWLMWEDPAYRGTALYWECHPELYRNHGCVPVIIILHHLFFISCLQVSVFFLSWLDLIDCGQGGRGKSTLSSSYF